MSREEALKKIKAEIRMYDEESHESVEWEECYEALKQALKQESVLDRIRSEIEKERTFQRVMDEYDIATGLRKALQIIDKYRAESEEKNDE